MAKTRSQTSNISIKKEEEEEQKNGQLLRSVNNTARNNKKITKQKVSRSKSSVVSAPEVKVEENTDVKPLLRAPPTLSTQYISQEQIKQLIHCIVNDKMATSTAATKMKINYTTAHYYYKAYKNNPEKKIPMPLQELNGNKSACTQEQIANLIKHIVDDGMTIIAASIKVKISYGTARRYYRKYLEDPDHKIPMQAAQKYKQEQIKSLIGYIVDDKMTLTEASAKAKLGIKASRKYYDQYLNDPNHGIPAVNPQSLFGPMYNQDQVNSLISFIVDDKMTIVEAARKANMTGSVGWRYYRKYKNDPNHRIPVVSPKSYFFYSTISEDQIKALLGYITVDKMTIAAASRKAKMCIDSGRRYYRRYRNDPNFNIKTPNQSAIPPGCTQEQMGELISFIVDDKMTVKDASKKASMSLETGEKYYQQYLNGLHHDVPTHLFSRQRCTEEQINTLVKCIVDDKMTIKAASKKANIHYSTGLKYFRKYVNGPNNNVPVPDHVYRNRPCTPEQINTLIRCIVDDKMSIVAASRKANMHRRSGLKYYHEYIDRGTDSPTRKTKTLPCSQEQITDLIRYIVEDKMPITVASKKANMCYSSARKYYRRYLQNHH